MEKVSTSHHYVIILCGGSGPRLWPMSTAKNPKQFLKLFNQHTLLENTISRCLKLVPSKQLYLISNRKYASKLRHLKCQIILEPQRRNTALAICLAAATIYKKDPNAIITTTPADHHISNNLAFSQDITTSVTLANQGAFATIGIRPTTANPSYGYIKKSKNSSRVIKFIEKPPKEKAKIYIQNHQWLWNSGIYTFSLSTLKHSLFVHNHQYYTFYTQLIENKSTNLTTIYNNAPSLSFEKVIAEKSHNLTTTLAHFDWNDVGEWRSIYHESPKDHNQIALLSKNTDYVSYQSSHCLLSSETKKLIGLVGIKNIAVIDTPQGLLICKLPLSSHVRDLVATIVADPKRKHFFTNDHR